MALKVTLGLLYTFLISCNLLLKKNYKILSCIAKSKAGQFKLAIYYSNNIT